MSELGDRWAGVRDRVAAATERSGRPRTAVRVVAVSKRHPPASIASAVSLGIGIVGENYAQELVAKYEALKGTALEWHFIGHLQRNKVKQVVGRCRLIHTLDSERLALEIGARAAEHGFVQDVLIEVNLAGEASKDGVAPDAAPALVERCHATPGLRCVGLMTMPPLGDALRSREYFASLRTLRDRLVTPTHPLPELSMGTTEDFEIAIEEGATLVRIGTAIFGPRPAPVPVLSRA